MQQLEKAPIVTPEAQMMEAKGTNTLDGYLNLYHTYLGGISYPNSFSAHVERNSITSPDFFRYASVGTFLVAQSGLPSQLGQIDRHDRKGWNKSVHDPRHMLANMVYIANINAQQYQQKRDLAKKLSEVDSDIAPAAWVIFPLIRVGKVKEIHNNFQAAISEASYRRNHSRPIALPDFDLNSKLALIKFSGYDADKMSDSDFARKVYPQAENALGDIFDTNEVFRPLTVSNKPVFIFSRWFDIMRK